MAFTEKTYLEGIEEIGRTGKLVASNGVTVFTPNPRNMQPMLSLPGQPRGLYGEFLEEMIGKDRSWTLSNLDEKTYKEATAAKKLPAPEYQAKLDEIAKRFDKSLPDRLRETVKESGSWLVKNAAMRAKKKQDRKSVV